MTVDSSSFRTDAALDVAHGVTCSCALHRLRSQSEIEETFASRTGEDLVTLMRGIGIPCGEVAPREEWLDNEQITAIGMRADVNVFDPDTVAPGPLRRVVDFPANGERLTADAPVGMRHTLVNGTAIRVDGTQVDAAVATRPGKVLRG